MTTAVEKIPISGWSLLINVFGAAVTGVAAAGVFAAAGPMRLTCDPLRPLRPSTLLLCRHYCRAYRQLETALSTDDIISCLWVATGTRLPSRILSSSRESEARNGRLMFLTLFGRKSKNISSKEQFRLRESVSKCNKNVHSLTHT